MYHKSILLLILMAFLLPGCKKNDPVNTIKFDLIVEGGISTYSFRQFIRLTKPADFDQANAAALPNAQVTVNDGEKDISFREIKSTGIYTAIVQQNKNYYKPYTLTILYNDKQYIAIDTLIPVLPIDAAYIPLTVSPKEKSTRLTIPKHTFGTSIAQQWLILPQEKIWLQENFREIYPFSYSHVFGTPDALHPLTQQARILDLKPNDSVNLYKFSLSDTYSKYLYKVFQETDWKGLLSSVPGNVKGNISGNANGYFYATDVEMQKRTLKSLAGK